MQTTITINEANDKVDAYITRAMAELPPGATLEVNTYNRTEDCSDPTDNGPKGRVSAGRSYKILGLQVEAIPSYFDTLRAWWQANNFRILGDTPRNEFLWVENNSDGFQMTLKANPAGGIYLLAGSPCVWSNGTPDPQAAGDQPATADVVALDRPDTSAVTPTAPKPPARRPRRGPAEETEDFDQTDWTSET
jgi:hypothetical protein